MKQRVRPSVIVKSATDENVETISITFLNDLKITGSFQSYRERHCVLIDVSETAEEREDGRRARREMQNTKYTDVHPKSIVINGRFVCPLLTGGDLSPRDFFQGSKANNHPTIRLLFVE